MGIFAKWAPIYRELGLEPRPVFPGTKACKLPGWQKSDAEIDSAVLEKWLTEYADFGIGLRLGTILAGGGTLVAFDVDVEGFTPLFPAIFGSLCCARKGARGAAYFARAITPLASTKFKTHAGEVAVDLLGKASFCVLPPTIHPEIHQPYTWLGTPLHECDLSELPIIEDQQ
jgi:hypothetical protein